MKTWNTSKKINNNDNIITESNNNKFNLNRDLKIAKDNKQIIINRYLFDLNLFLIINLGILAIIFVLKLIIIIALRRISKQFRNN